MSTKDTHLIPSDFALAVWSLMMVVNKQTPSCRFFARLTFEIHCVYNVWKFRGGSSGSRGQPPPILGNKKSQKEEKSAWQGKEL